MARAISWIEDGAPAAAPLLAALFPHAGRALVVGVTGPPGAGKSTLVDRLTAHLRAQGRTVGVIAVDPTSPYTGGAILGDRIRMQAHAVDVGVFIRSNNEKDGLKFADRLRVEPKDMAWGIGGKQFYPYLLDYVKQYPCEAVR